MSISSLWGISKDYVGDELIGYKNSWLFTPIIVQVLCEKYVPEMLKTPFGIKQVIASFDMKSIWTAANEKLNNCDNTPDRVCWEMSNQNIFFTKDKKCVAGAIRAFVKQNTQYDISSEDGIASLCREHIIKRFNEIANDIESLDEEKFPYFVFKNTSCDDGVERLFSEYNEETDETDEKSLKDWKEYVVEFVVISNEKIENFVSNLDYSY